LPIDHRRLAWRRRRRQNLDHLRIEIDRLGRFGTTNGRRAGLDPN
jgi:hypothetical protein